ncbi:MAG: prepilin-type N-terminal cleavage/methylation domain-containing protein [Firmicutes bacterium]|nr:prepilin-type N-terminal cleavage/methylation domain-containing protein [Bacillota bacterium]
MLPLWHIRGSYKKLISTPLPLYNNPKNHSGFTLIEVLIATGIAALLGTIILAIYFSSLQAYRGGEAKNQTSVKAQLALQQIGRVLAQACSCGTGSAIISKIPLGSSSNSVTFNVICGNPAFPSGVDPSCPSGSYNPNQLTLTFLNGQVLLSSASASSTEKIADSISNVQFSELNNNTLTVTVSQKEVIPGGNTNENSQIQQVFFFH